jgi:hypothetical protein
MTFPVFSAGTSAYNLTNSLRFRASATAYLSRTPASTGNRQIFTWSGWVKRGTLGNQYQNIFGAGSIGSGAGDPIYFQNDVIAFYADGGGSASLVTTQVFRDPSAWYHFVFSVDTTQATAANRIRMYVNGVQITAFSTASYPAQNYNFVHINNSGVVQYIGSGYLNNFDGYMDEINFIDGQALTPSSFGSTNPTTGVWQPAKYTGTYGTNGFYLPFTNTTSTTTLGNDFSGNGNNWTTNNISLTPGVTYDAMTDVPTLTSPTAANYCVLNPLIVNNKTGETAQTFSNANLQVRAFGDSNGSPYTNTQSTFGVTTGKWYFEVTHGGSGGVGDGNDNEAIIGVVNLNSSPNVASGDSVPGQIYTNNGAGYYRSGSVLATGATVNSSGNSYTTNDVIGVALDLTNLRVWFSKNGVWQGTGSPDPATNTSPNVSGLSSSGVYVPSVANYASSNVRWTDFIANFGQRPFAYTPPSGFLPLNTFNLPSSTIPAGNKFMDATLYTGTGSSLSVTNSGSMQPDWVWIKSRSAATDHALYDVLRGTQSRLESNTTDAEVTSDNGVTAFGTGGFTVGTLAQVNTNAATYVGWQWKANGAGVTNTAGSTTSTVSANTTSGFSVVTYAGNSTANTTIGHGLGVSPGLIIVKERNGSVQGWPVWHQFFAANQVMELESTGAIRTTTSIWSNTLPNSSVFYVGNNSGTNASGINYVAYCFAPIAGFSAFGSYTGNGSTDGPFIYTGFRPRWILVKDTTSSGNYWLLHDTSRSPFNLADKVLFPNRADAEATQNGIDILSNGFKTRTSGSNHNTNGSTYIYAAFAENPFKNALAR